MHTHVCAHLIIMLRIGIKFLFFPEHYLLERYLLMDPKLEFNLNLLLEPFSWNLFPQTATAERGSYFFC